MNNQQKALNTIKNNGYIYMTEDPVALAIMFTVFSLAIVGICLVFSRFL
jgi:hypothetical protein